MKKALRDLKPVMTKLLANSKFRSITLVVVAVLFILQLYFVQELLAAELLFGMAFAALFLLGALFYLLGAIGERGFDWTEAGVRVLAVSARRGYAVVEEISRKQFRHPRSQSAQ